jgi:hypothetical protein
MNSPTPIIAVVEHCFAAPTKVREAVLAGRFVDYVNSVDKVTYPAINPDLPDWVKSLFHEVIAFGAKRAIDPVVTFARAMHSGMVAPNKIHCDAKSQAGTGFWEHKKHGPIFTRDTPIDEIDCNNEAEWRVYQFVPALFNRCLIHWGNHWHRADPVKGYGDSPANGRLVLTCFFNFK